MTQREQDRQGLFSAYSGPLCSKITYTNMYDSWCHFFTSTSDDLFWPSSSKVMTFLVNVLHTTITTHHCHPLRVFR